MRRIDLTGQRFGRTLVVSLSSKQVRDRKRVVAQCICDCGNKFECQSGDLRTGHTKSCGCFNSDESSDRAKKNFTKHGKSGSDVYKTWNRMTQRCSNIRNDSYRSHGGRGIKVCDRWLKFENFYEDMGDVPKNREIDRIDNNKGYYKENCRWATKSENMRNRRNSKNWTVYGITYDSITQAATALNITKRAIQMKCDGYTSRQGNWIPPKPGCHSELKYKKEAT